MSHRLTRREVLKMSGSAAGLAFLPTTIQAAERVLTPRQTEGPFYPVEVPLDNDNDLMFVAGRSEPASGVVTNVFGQILDDRGRVIRGAVVEIWQCDAKGRYHHPGDNRDVARDENFQGFGRFTTAGDGAYRFRTIKPVPYPGRTPHIHFKIKGPGFEALTTQMYVAGETRNSRDGVLNSIRDGKARESLIVPFESNPDDSAKLMARFDIVIRSDGRFDTA